MTAIARKSSSSSQLLARLLESPELPARVAALEPAALARLIDEVGLEDAGELVALATTEQIAQVFDEDLWKNMRPGEEEHFDGERFVLWLEVMLEAGDTQLATRLCELPFDLVALAFHQRLLVLRVDDLLVDLREMEADDAVAVEKALDSALSEELDAYQLVARHHDGWDSVLSAFLALDRDHHHVAERLLDRLADLTASHVDDEGGLYEALTASETLAADVAAEREDRRAAAGHVAPAAAAAFLALARSSASAERDALTKAYFRDLAAPSLPSRQHAPRVPSAAAWLPLPPAAPEPLAIAPRAPRRELLLARAMQELSPSARAKRSEEIAYLANVLASGTSLRGRRLRPIEAMRAALATCNLGLELALGARRSVRRAAELLETTLADVLFRKAYARIARGHDAGFPSLEDGGYEGFYATVEDLAGSTP